MLWSSIFSPKIRDEMIKSIKQGRRLSNLMRKKESKLFTYALMRELQ